MFWLAQFIKLLQVRHLSYFFLLYPDSQILLYSDSQVSAVFRYPSFAVFRDTRVQLSFQPNAQVVSLYNLYIQIVAKLMNQPQKKRKLDDCNQPKLPDFQSMYHDLMKSSLNIDNHPYTPVLKALREKKRPILQVAAPQTDVYKSNPEKKKKPIELYLDTVNHLYKKRDLEILISPVTPMSVFEKWAPREVAIFEESILKFGKQFQFLAELIQTKNAKEVYEFYLEWKSTSHYKSYRSFVASSNRSNVEDLV